jgi:hypothetical protein
LCRLCIKAKKQNVLTEGTNNFRTTTLTRHAQSNDHQLSVIPKSADLIEVVSKAALSDNESAIIVAFHCVYEVCAWNECVGIDTPGINN